MYIFTLNPATYAGFGLGFWFGLQGLGSRAYGPKSWKEGVLQGFRLLLVC